MSDVLIARAVICAICFLYLVRTSFVLTMDVDEMACLGWMLLSVPHFLIILAWTCLAVDGYGSLGHGSLLYKFCVVFFSGGVPGLVLGCLVLIPMPFSVYIASSMIREEKSKKE